MKKLNKSVALTCLLALLSAQVQGQAYDDNAPSEGQEYAGSITPTQGEEHADSSAAYNESGTASIMSGIIPLGTVVIFGILIASTYRNKEVSVSSSSLGFSNFSHGHFSKTSSSSSSSSSSP